METGLHAETASDASAFDGEAVCSFGFNKLECQKMHEAEEPSRSGEYNEVDTFIGPGGDEDKMFPCPRSLPFIRGRPDPGLHQQTLHYTTIQKEDLSWKYNTDDQKILTQACTSRFFIIQYNHP